MEISCRATINGGRICVSLSHLSLLIIQNGRKTIKIKKAEKTKRRERVKDQSGEWS